MGETIVLDPAEVATNRAELDITPWMTDKGVDWGDAAISAYLADQSYGSSPVDYRLPNRTVKIPLVFRTKTEADFQTIRSRIQRKVALLQREGGWVARRGTWTPTQDPQNLYCDVVNATLHLGGDWMQAFRDIDIDASLELECLPDFYGDEETLDAMTGSPVLGKLKQNGVDAHIPGDYPARCRLVITETAGVDQRGLVWGLRSRYYDPSAPLTYEAESLTLVNGTTSQAVAGASGGNVARSATTLTPAGLWFSMFASGQFAHKGTYRVWARCRSATATPTFRVLWSVGPTVVNPVVNEAKKLPGANAFYLLDLGVVRLDPTVVGTHVWQFVIQAYLDAATDPAEVDSITLQPLDEAAGVAAYLPSDPASSVRYDPGLGWTNAADVVQGGTSVWTIYPSTNTTQAHLGQASVVSGATSHLLERTSFDASIPSGATVVGIALSASCVGHGVQSYLVQLLDNTTLTGSSRATRNTWPGAYAVLTWGSPTDLWGQAGGFWTPAKIATLGAGIQVINPTGSTVNAWVDWMAVTIYYTLAAGFTVYPDAVVYASSTTEVRTDGIFRANTATSATAYGRAFATGDLPRIPASGLESRPVELLLDISRGNLSSEADSALDSTSVLPKYRPCYLFRP